MVIESIYMEKIGVVLLASNGDVYIEIWRKQKGG